MDSRMREVLQRAQRVLDHKDYELMKAFFESYTYLAELVHQEDMTAERLYEMLYGPDDASPECVVTDGEKRAPR